MKVLFLLLPVLTSGFAYDIGETIPDDIAGRIGMERSKVYIIDFFASWCGSCAKEMSDLNRLHERLDPDRYELVGIEIDKDRSKAAAFRQQHRIAFRVIEDSERTIVTAFNPVGMPTLYIVENGKVTHIVTGARNRLDRVVLDYLKETHE